MHADQPLQCYYQEAPIIFACCVIKSPTMEMSGMRDYIMQWSYGGLPSRIAPCDLKVHGLLALFPVPANVNVAYLEEVCHLLISVVQQ